MARSGQLARNPARNTDRRMVNEMAISRQQRLQESPKPNPANRDMVKIDQTKYPVIFKSVRYEIWASD